MIFSFFSSFLIGFLIGFLIRFGVRFRGELFRLVTLSQLFHTDGGTDNDWVGEDEKWREEARNGEDADNGAAGHEHGDRGNHVGSTIDSNANGGGKEDSAGDDDGRNRGSGGDSSSFFFIFACEAFTVITGGEEDGVIDGGA